jgi:hypothetical protein
MDFEKGFATRALLTKHNRKWHSQIEDGMSLVEEIRALRKSWGQDGGAIANYYNPREMGPNGGMRGGRTQPPSPQQNTAPPTPSQSNKANPKKKAESKDSKAKVYSIALNRFFVEMLTLMTAG